jgi:uncharacterized membrane protein
MTDQTVAAPYTTRTDAHPIVQKISTATVGRALRAGFDDFMAKPSHVIFLVVIYPVIGILLGFMSSDAELMPLFFPLVAGFALVGPVAALGLYEISRRRERRMDVSWRDAFGVLRSPSIGAIVELSLLLAAIFLAWLVAADLIYRGTVGTADTSSIAAFMGDILTRPEGWTLIVLGHAVGFCFAALAFALGAVSFPLLLDRPVGVGTAIRTSFQAIRMNPVPMALWALTIAVLMMLGSATFFVGLALVLPILGHATWHMYRHLVAFEPTGH